MSRSDPRRNDRDHFFGILSGVSKAKFYTGVFFVFSIFGVFWAPSEPWFLLAAWVAYSGGIAAAYAYAFSRDYRLLALVIPLSVIVPTGLGYLGHRVGGVARTSLGAQEPEIMLLTILLTVAGYVFFISFIRGEGVRSLRLHTEVTLAKRIHDHLVPSVDLRLPRFEIRGVSASSSEVGGDLLDAVADGDSVLVCVADVSGHGVQAGLMMGMMKSAARMRLLHEDDLDRLVNDLNHVSFQVKPPEMFMTAAFMRFDASQTVRIALAGHPPILHHRRRTQTIDQIDSPHPPIGVVKGAKFAAVQTDYESGDLFLILTDGLTEVFDRNGEEFGLERIKAIVAERHDRPLAEIEAAILDAARAFGPQEDDQTLLLARVL